MSDRDPRATLALALVLIAWAQGGVLLAVAVLAAVLIGALRAA